MTRLRAAVLIALGAGLAAVRASAAELPVPCVGGNCGANGPAVWVTSGEAAATISGNRLTVNQASDRAILNWASFNVGANGEVVFQQPSATSVALNRIFQQDPSAILGAVSANGQVYLINPNGLVFGEGARVNVQSMIASTLELDDELFNGVGVVRAIDQEGRAVFEGTNPESSIHIEAGAELVAAGGGRIVVLAPEIINEGRIDTPDGQALLAASTDRVFLQVSNDSGLRGLLVEVDTGGTVTNIGDIVAPRGNITLAGLTVNQQGLVSATTSVRSNGSIRLLARDTAEVLLQGERPLLQSRNGGTLTLGENSITEVVPELDDPTLAVDEQAQALSNIELVGRQVTLETDALVAAAGGNVSVTATADPAVAGSGFVEQNNSQIFMQDGATIDVSGVASTVLPMERNIVELELRGNELADAPLQRDGPLRGESVRIDARVGTPLANIDGALAAIERGVGERLSSGGSVTLLSEGSVV
ncbi:MAG: filamentous hemagglutinin N-terminal domain-containing protein, partial [Pseudomonadota bacterium]